MERQDLNRYELSKKMAAARRIILVTGGNAGIGLALCRQLVVEEGCHVLLGQ